MTWHWSLRSMTVLGLLAVGFLEGISVSASATVPVDMGEASIVDPLNTSRDIDGGGSSVPFTIRLPSGSKCSGDSLNDQYRLRTFLVPEIVEVKDIVWGQSDPEGEGQWSLYGVDTNPVIADLTAPNASPGQPGLILPFRPMTFAVFTEGILAPGRYRLGVACIYFAETRSYWDTTVDVIADAADNPARLRWTVLASSMVGADDNGRSTTGPVLVAAAVMAAVVGGVLIRRKTHPALKESS